MTTGGTWHRDPATGEKVAGERGKPPTPKPTKKADKAAKAEE